jgi:hypothetical protein
VALEEATKVFHFLHLQPLMHTSPTRLVCLCVCLSMPSHALLCASWPRCVSMCTIRCVCMCECYFPLFDCASECVWCHGTGCYVSVVTLGQPREYVLGLATVMQYSMCLLGSGGHETLVTCFIARVLYPHCLPHFLQLLDQLMTTK